LILRKAKTIPGVRDVVQIPTGVAVLADNFWTAKVGRDALKIDWDLGANVTFDSNAQLDEYKRIAATEGLIIQRKGDVSAALKNAAKTLDATFSFPYLAHAPMEPLNCTVKISPDHCDVWTGTQSPLLHQAEIAAFLGFKPEQVQLYTPFLGGSFGRRGSFSSDWVMEAVHIAKASGKFIKLVWSREDDIKGGYYRPVYVHNGTDWHRCGWISNGLATPDCWAIALYVNTPLAELIVQKGIDYSSVTKGGSLFRRYSRSIL
jgi:isoquinoline 1-oxidoreductase beta subunit